MISQWALIVAGVSYFVAAYDYASRWEIILAICFICWGTANILFSFIEGTK